MIRFLAAAVHGAAALALLLIAAAALTAMSAGWGFLALALCVVFADQLLLWPLWAATGRDPGWHPVRGWIR